MSEAVDYTNCGHECGGLWEQGVGAIDYVGRGRASLRFLKM